MRAHALCFGWPRHASIHRVERIDEELNGYDPAHFWSYQHPDVVFPGGDIVWSVVFDRASGDLVEVYDFN